MKNQINVVSHEESGGLDLGLTLITGGAGLLTALDPKHHEVTVEHNGNYGVGEGKTFSEAKKDATTNLSGDKRK